MYARLESANKSIVKIVEDRTNKSIKSDNDCYKKVDKVIHKWFDECIDTLVKNQTQLKKIESSIIERRYVTCSLIGHDKTTYNGINVDFNLPCDITNDELEYYLSRRGRWLNQVNCIWAWYFVPSKRYQGDFEPYRLEKTIKGTNSIMDGCVAILNYDKIEITI